MKIVINVSHGGFYVSEDFCKYYNIPYRKEVECGITHIHPEAQITRKDKRLISFIENFGSKAASGQYSYLVIKKIPQGAAYRISEYDGAEYIELRDEIDWKFAD